MFKYEGNFGNKVGRLIKSYRLYFYDDLNNNPDKYSKELVARLNKELEHVSFVYKGRTFIVRKVGYKDDYNLKTPVVLEQVDNKKAESEPEKQLFDINWKVRIKSKQFWLTLLPAIVFLIYIVLGWFDIEIDHHKISEELVIFVEVLFVVLMILGIVVDPTTRGVHDSNRALNYEEPKDDTDEEE